MRRLFKKYMAVPKNGRLKECVFYTNIAVSVIMVLAFLASMQWTAYAYFADAASTSAQTLTAANFDVKVTLDDGLTILEPNTVKVRGEVGSYLSAGTPDVTYTDGNVSIELDAPKATAEMIAELTADEDPAELSYEEDGVYGYEFTANGSQTFTFTADGTASTGYCVVQIGDYVTAFTPQIYRDEADGIQSFTLTVNAPEGTEVYIVPYWGNSEYYDAPATLSDDEEEMDILDDDTITVDGFMSEKDALDLLEEAFADEWENQFTEEWKANWIAANVPETSVDPDQPAEGGQPDTGADAGVNNNGGADIGDTGSGDANNGDANNGDANNGDANNGDANNGDANNGDANNGDANNGDANNGDANNGDANNGDANNGDANNGNANNGDANNGDTNNDSANNGNTGNGNAENVGTDNGSAGSGDSPAA